MSSRLSIPAVSSDTVANISTYLSDNDTTSFPAGSTIKEEVV